MISDNITEVNSIKENKVKKRKIVIQEYVLPFFGMFAVLCICIILHRLFIHRGVMIGSEEISVYRAASCVWTCIPDGYSVNKVSKLERISSFMRIVGK